MVALVPAGLSRGERMRRAQARPPEPSQPEQPAGDGGWSGGPRRLAPSGRGARTDDSQL